MATDCVRFSKHSILLRFPKQPSNERELKTLFYDKQDIRQFRRDAAISARELRDRSCGSDLELLACFAATEDSKYLHLRTSSEVPDEARGLESAISGNVMKLMVCRKRLAIESVIREQEIQRVENNGAIVGNARLGQVSEEKTRFARAWASLTAIPPSANDAIRIADEATICMGRTA